MSFVIRDASIHDAFGVSEIYNQAIETRYSIGNVEPIPITSHATWIKEASPAMPFLVGLVSGEIISWACVRPFSDSPYFEGTVKSSLFVHKDFRRKNFGTQTKIALMQRSEKAGLSRMLSSCFSTNLGSIALNLALGFAEWARLPNVAKIDGSHVDLLTFGLEFTGSRLGIDNHVWSN